MIRRPIHSGKNEEGERENKDDERRKKGREIVRGKKKVEPGRVEIISCEIQV